MSPDLEKDLLKSDIKAGDVGMVLEHLADINPSKAEIKQTLAEALMVRAEQKESEALEVFASSKGTKKDAGGFERRRAENLRNLAKQILDL